MKKYLLTVIMMISAIFCLHAETIDASYRVSFGILGEIGKARAHLERAGDRYTIEVSGEATGLAKSLSRNRTETQVSQGHIKA
ncbi:MAG TPA: DUF3108 domain-containing protein, partial [Epsilonproteobacteria bacterium]|nr:DUF3108 domain-containing protein [Campylobacterota bacterium]